MGMTPALLGAGYEISVAGDAQEALLLVDRFIPDLILLDMPTVGVDGYKLCAEFKGRAPLIEVPVIFAAPPMSSADVVEGFRSGAADYITLPLAPAELIARVAVHLTASRTARVARYALEAVGSRLIAADAQGQIIWATAPAYALLEEWLPSLHVNKQRMTDALHKLISRREAPCDPPPSTVQLGVTACGIVISLIGRTPAQDYLLRLSEAAPEKEQEMLVQRLGLTRREAEVLFWVARGKSNPDIRDILCIALRTVNKHLEQIFIKLGIENRAAAAALAIRAVDRVS